MLAFSSLTLDSLESRRVSPHRTRRFRIQGILFLAVAPAPHRPISSTPFYYAVILRDISYNVGDLVLDRPHLLVSNMDGMSDYHAGVLGIDRPTDLFNDE